MKTKSFCLPTMSNKNYIITVILTFTTFIILSTFTMAYLGGVCLFGFDCGYIDIPITVKLVLLASPIIMTPLIIFILSEIAAKSPDINSTHPDHYYK